MNPRRKKVLRPAYDRFSAALHRSLSALLFYAASFSVPELARWKPIFRFVHVAGVLTRSLTRPSWCARLVYRCAADLQV